MYNSNQFSVQNYIRIDDLLIEYDSLVRYKDIIANFCVKMATILNFNGCHLGL